MARCFDLEDGDTNQAYIAMLMTVLKRTVVLKASERAHVAELLTDPWFHVGDHGHDLDRPASSSPPFPLPAMSSAVQLPSWRAAPATRRRTGRPRRED